MITLTAHADFDPCPRVEIVVDAIPGADTVTITRTYNGETAVVRRGRRVDMGSPTFIVDYEVPFGVPVDYVATGYSALDAAVGSETASTQVDVVLDPSLVVVQSPLAPITTRRVVMAGGSLAALQRQRAVGLEYAIGSPLPFSMGGELLAPSGVPWTIYTHDDAESQAVLRLLGRSGPLLLRSMWPVPLPRLAYVMTGDLNEIPIDAASAPDFVTRNWTAWETTLNLVRPPAASIAVPVYTYDDVEAMYVGKTYDEVKATRPGATYLDWARDPRP